jgi:non-specific serine/threonine protein kinase
MSRPPDTTWIEPFSQRELEILGLIGDGLSNREIAARLFLSVDTIKWYNKELFGKLGVNSRTQALKLAREHRLLVPEAFERGAELPRTAPSLPAPLTSYVGRAEESAELRRLLTQSRLVVLTGAGGTGKTRLALHVAASMAEEFRDGVALVDLAPVRQPAGVADAIALALKLNAGGASSSTVLQKSLAHRHLLLLLDNFEHVLDAGPLLTTLLAAAPRLTFLVTSRERLQLYGEVDYPVRPLSVPDLRQQQGWQELLAYDAVTLFIQRAQAAKPDLELTEANVTAAARISARLDGLPLALELAASQTGLYPLPYLARHLEQSPLALPEGPRDLPTRHRTLEATIAWSVNLLKADAQRLLARLTVFRGGAALDSIQAVCAPGLAEDVLEGIAALVNKNLLFMHESQAGEPRFVMLETIRESAYARLSASGEAVEIHQRHAAHFADLAEQYSREIYTSRSVVWNGRLQAEQGNLNAALAWSLAKEDPSLGLRLFAALAEHWYYRGTVEDSRWAELAIEKAQAAPPALAAAVYTAAGMLYHCLGNMARVALLQRRAADLFQTQGDVRRAAWALIILGIANSDDPAAIPGCIAMVEEGAAVLRRCGDKPGLSRALSSLGELRRMQGDYEGARAAYAEGLALAQQTGERVREAIHYSNLGFVAYHQGQNRLAIEYTQRGLTILAELDVLLPSTEFYILAGAVAALGRPSAAAQLIGAADAQVSRAGVDLQPPDRQDSLAIKAAVRQALDADAYQAAWQAGSAFAAPEALRFALRL